MSGLTSAVLPTTQASNPAYVFKKTEWARDKVEYLYLRANKLPLPPPKAEASQTAKKPAVKVATKKPTQTAPEKPAKSDKPSSDGTVNSHIWGNN